MYVCVCVLIIELAIYHTQESLPYNYYKSLTNNFIFEKARVFCLYRENRKLSRQDLNHFIITITFYNAFVPIKKTEIKKMIHLFCKISNLQSSKLGIQKASNFISHSLQILI